MVCGPVGWVYSRPVSNDRDMVDSGSDSVVVAAAPERCFEVASSFEQYPTWARDVKEAIVLDRDSEGRPSSVEYRASALGRSTHFILQYDYSQAPRRLSWHMVDGDIMRSIRGAYTFDQVAEGTRVSYDLAIELVIPLPGFVTVSYTHLRAHET